VRGAAILAFIRLGRPLFLGGGFILYALGAVVAHGGDLAAIDARAYALGQAAVTAFQLMTHYANDYFDLAADRANTTPTRWSGGSRVLAGGELSPRVALYAALALAAIGSALTAVIAQDEPRTFATFATMAILAWTYSAPPTRLCARGLGELDTAVIVTGLVPYAAFQLQHGRAFAQLLGSIAPLALLQIAMLLAIEVPDAAGDAATGKRTLVVRLGRGPAVALYGALTAAAYVALAIGYATELPARVAIAGALTAPIAAWRIARMRSDAAQPEAYERLTFVAVLLLSATSVAILVGWLA